MNAVYLTNEHKTFNDAPIAAQKIHEAIAMTEDNSLPNANVL